MEHYSIFSDRLRQAMAYRGFTQRDLSEASGVSMASISNYLTSARIPQVTTALMMQALLGCPVEWLLGRPCDYATNRRERWERPVFGLDTPPWEVRT